ncbi:hypothetical protein ASD11_10330 [Aeromicrobium sp. Root495]|uniref:thermonuclease family protein n=1 Tax=Aeromicrobium sp. Root495 TaxID=1736550 RepID=UPI0006FCEF74|nr:thermonuclease family protein [Aeromicrobium sp. Root495]KQY59901.1 hypothetical protein ASD11_10330 [Aeromicrobium sp. Root495]RYJ06655.1 MAG: hypothetical protein EON52_05245 [Actinomycetales bacterium]
MDQMKRRSSVMLMVAIVVVGGIFYLVKGGSSKESVEPGAKKPYDAFVMTVGSVKSDGTFRGRVERTGRYASKGLRAVGTNDFVSLRLADLQQLEPVRDPCWTEEGRRAIDDLIGARIWVEATTVERDRRGRFLVFAWNRDDTFVQEQLLRDGNAALFSGRLDVRHRDVLGAAEEAAAKGDVGRWGTCGSS